jgi:lipopolysaccharide/colanic/teichoic acid biosynthesis glycosyltransferase
MVPGADDRSARWWIPRLRQSFKVPNDPAPGSGAAALIQLDETPQLPMSVRMSIVGPRPEQVELVAHDRPEHRFRLQVKPGMTGPMQVYGRGDLTFEERLALERAYIDNLSIAQDVAILLRTPRAVIGGTGAY